MNFLIDYALSFVGKPYIWGGEGPSGFDCSGLVQEILRSVGEDPRGDQTADALFRFAVKSWHVERGPGAVAFYGDRTRMTHCAFLIDDFRVVEAGGGGSTTRTPGDADRAKAMVRVRPYDHRSDLVAVYRPLYLRLKP